MVTFAGGVGSASQGDGGGITQDVHHGEPQADVATMGDDDRDKITDADIIAKDTVADVDAGQDRTVHHKAVEVAPLPKSSVVETKSRAFAPSVHAPSVYRSFRVFMGACRVINRVTSLGILYEVIAKTSFVVHLEAMRKFVLGGAGLLFFTFYDSVMQLMEHRRSSLQVLGEDQSRRVQELHASDVSELLKYVLPAELRLLFRTALRDARSGNVRSEGDTRTVAKAKPVEGGGLNATQGQMDVNERKERISGSVWWCVKSKWSQASDKPALQDGVVADRGTMGAASGGLLPEQGEEEMLAGIVSRVSLVVRERESDEISQLRPTMIMLPIRNYLMKSKSIWTRRTWTTCMCWHPFM